ncbi:MAG: hypothetical protein NTY77_16410 [Elusimicrobia bacterium]|nr:hypothetical protein [Elusimicrobiota bacterium]
MSKLIKVSVVNAEGDGREWSISVPVFGLLAPLAAVIALVALAAVPWLPGPRVETVSAEDLIVPLNVRDPSALVMAPLDFRSLPSCACPAGKKR